LCVLLTCANLLRSPTFLTRGTPLQLCVKEYIGPALLHGSAIHSLRHELQTEELSERSSFTLNLLQQVGGWWPVFITHVVPPRQVHKG